MLPRVRRLKSGMTPRGRGTLLACSLVMFALPTWFVTAQVPDANKPGTESKTPAADPGQVPVANTVNPPAVEFFPEYSSKEQLIIDQLDSQTTIDLTDESLDGVREMLMDRHKFDIIFETVLLQEQSIATDAADLNLKVNEITLRSALKLLLRRKQLAFVIEDDVMKITTESSYQTDRLTRTYPVRDLTGDSMEEFQSLIEAIKQGVTPGDWKASSFTRPLPAGNHPAQVTYFEAGPEGKSHGNVPLSTISMIPASGSLVIHQSWQGHDEVLKLLRSLRKAKSQSPPRPGWNQPRAPQGAQST